MTDDRYHVDPTNDNAAFAEWKRGIEARLSSLEGAPITGTLRVRGPGGAFDVFHVDEEGMDAPQFPLPQNFIPDVGGFGFSISGGSYLLASRTILPPIVSHAAVRMHIGWSFSNTTTQGNIRVESRQLVFGPDILLAATDGPTRGPNANATDHLDWFHQIPLGEEAPGGFYYIDVLARVTSGAGAIQIYEPSVTLLNPSHGATIAGVWTAS